LASSSSAALPTDLSAEKDLVELVPVLDADGEP
jgi:hypothetical protein